MEISKKLWYYLCRYILSILSDDLFTKISSWLTFKRLGFTYYSMDYKNPRSFNEKLNYLKFQNLNPIGTIIADKYKVRDYVAKVVGKQYLIPLIGVYKNASEIPFESLPSKFVLKTNHGSGWNILCTDKSKLDINKTKNRLNTWLSWNAYYLSREKQYKYIPPVILCEKMLAYNLNDYKIFCFDGEPIFIQVDVGRFTSHKRAYFNLNWELQHFSIRYPIYKENIAKPSNLNEMLSVAKELARGLKFVRVDLYEYEGKVFFGELTLIPGGGNEPFIDNRYDFELGKYITVNTLN